MKANDDILIYQMDDSQQQNDQTLDKTPSPKSDDKQNQLETNISQKRTIDIKESVRIKVQPVQVTNLQNRYSYDFQYSDADSPTKFNLTNKSIVFQEQKKIQFHLKKISNDLQIDDSERILKKQQDKISTLQIQKQQDAMSQQSYSSDLENQLSDGKIEQSQQSNFEQPSHKRGKIIKKNKNIVQVQEKLQSFIVNEIPIGYKISCFVQVQSKYFGLSTQYNLTLKDNNSTILSAKKQHFKLYSSFIICTNKNFVTKRNNDHSGFLTANFSGTSYDLILNFKDCEYEQMIMKIEFSKNILGFEGIRKLQAMKLDPELKTNRSSKKDVLIPFSEILLRNQKSKIKKITTVQPKIIKGRYKIDFKGKAKLPSCKNFILQDNNKKQCLLFAKQSQTKYLLQVCYPLSIYEAFGICLANLDSKLMVN